MLIVISLLVAVTVAGVVYVAFPQKNVEFLYGVTTADSRLRSLYRRSATGWFASWDLRYKHTGGSPKSNVSVGRLVLIVAGAGLLVGSLITRNPVGGLVLFAAVVGIWWSFLSMQVNKREKKITSQLVDFLDGVRQSLTAGGSLENAIKKSTVNVQPPLRYELDRLTADMDSHVPLALALRALARRNSSRAMAFTCATLEISSTNGAETIRKSLYGIATMIRKNEQAVDEVSRRTLITRVAGKAFIVVPPIALIGSMMFFGTEVWGNLFGIGVIIFIAIGIIGSQFIFSALKHWQEGV